MRANTLEEKLKLRRRFLVNTMPDFHTENLPELKYYLLKLSRENPDLHKRYLKGDISNQDVMAYKATHQKIVANHNNLVERLQAQYLEVKLNEYILEYKKGILDTITNPL